MRELKIYVNMFVRILLVIFIGVFCYEVFGYEYDNEAMVWALGEGWGNLSIGVIDDVWNERHSDIFILFGSEYPHEALVRMENAYWNQAHTIKDLEFDVEQYLDTSSQKRISQGEFLAIMKAYK